MEVERTEARFLKKRLEDFASTLKDAPVLHQKLKETAACLTQHFDLRAAHYHAENRKRKTTSVKSLQSQRNYFRRKAAKLERTLATQSGEKMEGRLHINWFIRTGLADPAIPSRTLQDWCRDFHDTELKTISHTTIGAARDTFAEMIKISSGQALAQVVEKLPAAFESCSPPLVLTHVHDEALMRLRSYDSGLDPRRIRARSSKVQNNSLFVVAGQSKLECFSELQPLLRKDAKTLGQAIINAVSEVMLQLQEISPDHWHELRFFHMLTGDGVHANALAARYVLAHFQQVQKVGSCKLRYFLLTHICSSHQANLAVGAAITGSLREDPTDLVANCSRLYKHLIPDYLEEFSAALRRHVEAERQFVQGDLSDPAIVPPAGRRYGQDLQSLYGTAVLPDELLDFFNFDLRQRVHVSTASKSLEEVRSAAFELIHRFVLKIEEKPVVTRFFLFAPCVNALVLMKILQLPASVFRLAWTRARENNQRRLKSFHAWFSNEDSEGHLRTASLCLQLTTHAVALTAIKSETAANEDPLLVRLGKGEVQDKTMLHFWKLLGLLPLDPVLRLADTLEALLNTQCHLLIRFDKYKEFPTKHFLMSRQFNPDNYVHCIEQFLHTDLNLLDAGYGVPLRNQAWQCGGLAEAMAFLMSDHIQDELVAVFCHGHGTSLEVERKHQAVKRSEKAKVTSVSRASRNCILQRYKLLRNQVVLQNEKQRTKAKKLRHMNFRALGVQKRPDLVKRPRGRLKWEKDISPEEARSIQHEGNDAAFSAYLADNELELKKEAADLREKAKVLSLPGNNRGIPLTNAEWMDWLTKHDDLFRSSLRTSTAERRQHNQRLKPSETLVPPARYLLPRTVSESKYVWQKILLQQKKGWFCLDIGSAGKFVFFAACLRGEIRIVELKRASGCNRTFVFSWLEQAKHVDVFVPVTDWVASLGQETENAEIFRLDLIVQKYTVDECIFFHINGAKALFLTPRKQGAKSFDSDAEESFSEEDDLGRHAPSEDSDAESLVSSVEVDDEIEDIQNAKVSSDDEGPRAASAPKLQAGSHIIASDAYFTLADYQKVGNKGDAKIILRERWAVDPPVGLGKSHKSKTLQIATFDTDIRAPHRTYILLRSWSLWRCKQEHGWLDYSPQRRAWYNREFAQLKKEILELGFGPSSTGHSHADALIRQWEPRLFD